MLLTKEQIIGVQDRKTQVVTVEEWGGDVTLIEPSAKDVDDIQDAMMKLSSDGKKSDFQMDNSNIRAKTVVRCILNADGTQMFKDSEADELGKKSDVVIGHLYNLIEEMQGTVKDAEKN